MEIKKSYELRQVGEQLVLRMMSAPDFEMKKVLTADELVAVKYENGNPLTKIGNTPFFVLRQGETFVLCWEKRNKLQIVTDCQKYAVFEDTLLLERDNVWYWWIAASDADQLYPLGKKIFAIGPAFILQDGEAMLFLYFEGGAKLQTKRCFGYEVLAKEMRVTDLLHTELFVDVLKLDTAEGEQFLSIEKKTGPSYAHMGGIDKGKVTYHFKFAKAQALELTAFTNFANAVCVELCQKGFSVPVGFGGKSFNPAEMREKLRGDVKITISAGLLHMLDDDVKIEVDLRKLYHRENQAYLIKCETVGYYKTADEIRLEKTPNEHALFITSDGVTDKIFCKGGYLLGQNCLTLMTKV